MTKQNLSAIENLSAVATHTVEAYNTAGKTLAAAWRCGVERTLARAAARHQAYRQEKPSLLSDAARDQLLQARQKWNALVLQRVEAGTDSVVNVLDRVAVATTSGIDAAAQRLAMIDSPAARSYIDSVIALQLPVARLSAQVADQVVAGVQRIEAKVEQKAGELAEVTDVVARPAARRRARKAV